MNLPAGSAPPSTVGPVAGVKAIELPADGGEVTARCWPTQVGNTSSDVLRYRPVHSSLPEMAQRRREHGGGLGRLLQCADLEEAIRDWDAEAIRNFVKMLELTVVPFDTGDPLKPGIHIWQRVLE